MARRASLTWGALLRGTEDRLSEAGVPNPQAEAGWMLERATGRGHSDLLCALDEPAGAAPVSQLDAMVNRRRRGEPIQYVLGSWAFRTLDLHVDRRVLIPRPETELVCGVALDELRRAVARPGRAVDLGAGSGALALSLAVERPGTEVWAVERSPGAAGVALENLAALGQAGRHVRIEEGSWFGPLPPELRGAIDVVVSNPPYVAAGEALPREVLDWEPFEALVAGPSGLECIAEIVRQSPGWLAPGGALVVEIGATQGDEAAGLAREAGFGEVEVRPDLAGHPRVLVAHRRAG